MGNHFIERIQRQFGLHDRHDRLFLQGIFTLCFLGTFVRHKCTAQKAIRNYAAIYANDFRCEEREATVKGYRGGRRNRTSTLFLRSGPNRWWLSCSTTGVRSLRSGGCVRGKPCYAACDQLPWPFLIQAAHHVIQAHAANVVAMKDGREDRRDLRPTRRACEQCRHSYPENFHGDHRYGHVDKVAALAAFLAGPESSCITGSNITVDGEMNA
jgi:hypothetical protein